MGYQCGSSSVSADPSLKGSESQFYLVATHEKHLDPPRRAGTTSSGEETLTETFAVSRITKWFPPPCIGTSMYSIVVLRSDI